MKYILGALAAVTLFAGVASVQPAEARCFWNGYGWNCFNGPHHHWHGWHHHHWHDWR